MFAPHPASKRRLSVRLAMSAAALILGTVASLQATAQSAQAVAASARVATAVDPSNTVRLAGHIPGWRANARDLGEVGGDTQLNNLVLLLSRAPQVQAAFDQFLADVYNPSSPTYHQWLTPQQNAEQFGIAPADLQAVTEWMKTQGLSVDSMAAGGVFLTFSGTAANVAKAFNTPLHTFAVGDMTLRSPMADPAVPAALNHVIAAVAGLDDTRMRSHNIHHLAEPGATTGAGNGGVPFLNGSTGSHYIGPADWNTIYDSASVIAGGTTGAGNKVLILDYGDISDTDISSFESYFGLGITTLPTHIVLAGSTNPGQDGINGWQSEGSLDVERVLGTAPGSAIDYYIAATSSYNNTFAQLSYNISTLNDPIVSMSFGSCEVAGSSSTPTNFDTYFKTGAAQGIGNYVSSGDTGAAGCDTNGSPSPTTQHLAPNVVCASGYATCVGGTEFVEGTGTYWSTSNNATTKLSALSYIPEGAWNEGSCTSGSCSPAASGGGVSFNITKPTWQTGTGVPADGFRDTPDVAFTSAGGHDGYAVCIAVTQSGGGSGGGCSTASGGFYVFGGTSAAAPSMAGVAALLNQKLGARQGNLNPSMYSLAAKTASNVFHDTTVATSGVGTCSTAQPSLCNNSTPAPTTLTGGQAGYALTAGYDQVTGLGSIDVANFLIASLPGVSTTTVVTASPNPVAVNVATTLTATITSGTSTFTPSGTVQFYSAGTAIGTPQTVASNKATLSYTYTTAGTYAVTAVYSGDSNFATSTSAAASVTVTAAPTFSVTASPATLTLNSGATMGNTLSVSLASLNNFAGTVALTCTVTKTSGTAAGTCSLAPNSVALAAAGTASSTLTLATTAGTGGVLSVTVTGTSGTNVVTSTATTVTVNAPGFVINPAVTSLTVASGAVTGNTASVTITSVNGFTGNVAVSCAIDTLIPPTGNVNSTTTNCLPSSGAPATVALTAGSTATTTITVNTTYGAGGSFNGIISGTGTTTGSSIAANGSSSLPVVITAPGFTLGTVAASATSIAAPGTSTLTVPVTSTNGFAGTVTVACTVANKSGTAAGTCGSTTVTLTAGATATATLTLTSTTGTAGTVQATVSASGTTAGSAYAANVVTGTSPVVTVNAPAVTLTPGVSSITFTSGAVTGNSATITATSSYGFAGTVNFSCSIAVVLGSPGNPASCAASPASATLTSGGTATTVVTITSVTAHAKNNGTAAANHGFSPMKAGGALFALLLAAVPFRRRRPAMARLLMLLIAAGGLSALAGCGGGGNAPTPPVSSAGSYTVTVTGAYASTTATTSFTVNIN